MKYNLTIRMNINYEYYIKECSMNIKMDLIF